MAVQVTIKNKIIIDETSMMALNHQHQMEMVMPVPSDN